MGWRGGFLSVSIVCAGCLLLLGTGGDFGVAEVGPARAGAADDGAVVGAAAPTPLRKAKRSAKKRPAYPLISQVGRSGLEWEFRDSKKPSAVDLADDGRRLVADGSANAVLTYGPEGKLLSRIPASAPVDADFLPGGGVLITNTKPASVVEVDRTGHVVWKFERVVRPSDADRLPNGNTLIADSRPGRVFEVTPTGEIVWSFSEGLAYPYDVEAKADGTVLIADYNRHLVQCVRRDGSTCWRVNELGHPSQLTLLREGGFLVSTHKAGSIVWVGNDHQIVSQWTLGPDIEDFAIGDGQVIVAQRLWVDDQGTSAVRTALSGGMLDRLGRGDERTLVPEPGVRVVAGGPPTQRKNLLLILFDSLRWDHVPWSGYWRRTTPHLAKLASDGLVFDQYITQAPWTKPSVASLLTSTYASTHGATSQKPKSLVPASLTTLAEALADAGYYTAAVMENPHMGDRLSTKGFEQGYEYYDYVPERSRGAKAKKGPANAEKTLLGSTQAALQGRPAGKPFFLTMFFMNPHYPYEPKRLIYGDKSAGPSNPGPWNEYDAEIREADAMVGRVLQIIESTGVGEDTIVVFSSDHGEEFGDHRLRFHGDTLFDCVIKVPLLISGVDRVGRFPGLVREIDLMPTLLDFVGVTPPPSLVSQLAGRSVRSFLEPGVSRTGLVAYSQSRFRDNVHLVSERSEDRKVIADFTKATVSIYDLRSDAQEYNDLATERDQKRELERLRRWEAGRIVVREPESGPTKEVPEEVLERLRAAGYLEAD